MVVSHYLRWASIRLGAKPLKLTISLVSMFVFGIISIEVWHTQMPVWAFVLALIIGRLIVDHYVCGNWSVDCSVRICDPHRHDSGYYESANWLEVRLTQPFDNLPFWLAFFSVITELIIGYALPGRPVAMMMFKTWGYIVSLHAFVVEIATWLLDAFIDDGPSSHFLLWLQAGPLHEDSAQVHVLVSDRGDGCSWYRSARRSGLDVHKHHVCVVLRFYCKADGKSVQWYVFA